MADVAWPSSLQQKLNQASFTFGIGNTMIRSESDIGPAKVRRRFTKSVDTLGATIWVNAEQFETLYNLFDIDLNGGAGVLAFVHPITNANIRVRFTSPPSFSFVGFDSYEVTLSWEILP